jgi:tetratricopeptide (TPR) repeat protein
LKRFKDISFAILWVIVSLIPVCGIVTLSLPALEHRLYLATVCFSMILPLVAGRLSCFQTQTNKMNKAKALALVIVPTVLIFYSAKTVARNTVWKDELTFWSKAVHDYPASPVAASSLGVVYARAGEHQLAIGEFKKALALADQESVHGPGHGKVHKGKLFNNLGQSYYQLLRKHLQNEAYSRPTLKAEEPNSEREGNNAQRLYELSLACYQHALKISPANAEIHNNLGDLFYVMKNYPDAEEEYMKALQHNPDNAQYYNNLGLVCYSLKNYEDAEEKFSRAISLQHNFLEARNNLALVYLHLGMYQKALEQLEMVLSYGPDDNAGVYFNLALVYLRGFHDSERAAYYLRESLRLNRHISKDQMVRDSSCGRSDGRAVDRHT